MPRLLIVDDEPDAALLSAATLRRHEYECHIAHDGEEAWAHLVASGVDLVLLDVGMPGESGPELLRRMQLDPTLAAIPVIFVTGRADSATRIHCLAMGARAFLSKPVRRQTLLETVRDVLRSTETPDDLDEDGALEAAIDLDVHAAPRVDTTEQRPVGDLVDELLAERDTLRRRLAGHTRLLAAMVRLHRLTGAGYPPERVAHAVCRLAMKVLNAAGAAVWTVRDEQLSPLATTFELGAVAIPLGADAAVARAWRGEPAPEPSAHHERLVVAGDAIGVLSLRLDRVRPSASLATLYCAEAALALDAAARLRATQSEATTDALTGVANRRHLDRTLPATVARARATGSPASVLFLDLDRFKAINDAAGHDHGDRVLRTVAGIVRAAIRDTDLVCRYGGEEFVVVLPETPKSGAADVAERIRHAVRTGAVSSGHDDGPVTLTIGVASFPDDGDDVATLITAADTAMLRGKSAGRDRVEVAGQVVTTERRTPWARQTSPTVAALVRGLRAKDPATAAHSIAVARLAGRMARQMGLSPQEIGIVHHVGLLHDIGKLFIPDQILHKPGPLDPAERVIMESHAPLGADLVATIAETHPLADAVRASQEFFDGTGYPDRLSGEAIPLPARIVATADAYHAMVSDRPYRAGRSRDAALAELERCAGTQFDPRIVAAARAVTGAVASTRSSDLAHARNPIEEATS
jgi:diguanylate cyclase (GGDEF)-like protein/putative nucleotidyltransferase with HDIG domain